MMFKIDAVPVLKISAIGWWPEWWESHSTLSEQIAHSTVDLHLKQISEFLHGSVMNKNLTLPWPICGTKVTPESAAHHHIHIFLMSGYFIFSLLTLLRPDCQDSRLSGTALIYYQCTKPSIIVRQHDQGASTYIKFSRYVYCPLSQLLLRV